MDKRTVKTDKFIAVFDEKLNGYEITLEDGVMVQTQLNEDGYLVKKNKDDNLTFQQDSIVSEFLFNTNENIHDETYGM